MCERTQIFEIDHQFSDLYGVSYSELKRIIAAYNYSQIWGTSDLVNVPLRAAVRPKKGKHRGTETAGNDNFPQAGAWFSAPGENQVYMLQNEEVQYDRTQVRWMQQAGFNNIERIDMLKVPGNALVVGVK